MYQSRQKTDGCWHSSTGVSPRPMLMGAARNALWAFNARVSLTACMSSPAGCHACFADRCGSLAPKGGHGAPAVWLGTEQNVSVCLIPVSYTHLVDDSGITINGVYYTPKEFEELLDTAEPIDTPKPRVHTRCV